MKGEINNNTIIVGDFNTRSHLWTDQLNRKKETQTLNDTIDQLDPIDIYSIFHPKTMNFIFFSSAHGIFSRIDHILAHQSSLGKFKKNWNHSKHLFWPLCSKIRCQLQGKKRKKLLKLPTYGGKATHFWIIKKIKKKKSKYA